MVDHRQSRQHPGGIGGDDVSTIHRFACRPASCRIRRAGAAVLADEAGQNPGADRAGRHRRRDGTHVALHLGKVLGQQFYVENRGGAGNTLGIDSVVRSPADGYTLLLGAGTITINHLVYKNLPYDVLRDLTPVTQMVSVPNVLVVHPSQPMRTLADYIAAAKAKPGQINYGSAGVGSNLHLAMELLKVRTGIEVTHVPYKGVGPAMQDTLAGHIMSMMSNVAFGQAAYRRRQASRARGHVTQALTGAAGRAVDVRGRHQGLRGAELVRPVRAGRHAAADRRSPAGRGRGDVRRSRDKPALAGEGAEPVASKPAEFAAFVRAEIKKWDEVGKAANIVPTE